MVDIRSDAMHVNQAHSKFQDQLVDATPKPSCYLMLANTLFHVQPYGYEMSQDRITQESIKQFCFTTQTD